MTNTMERSHLTMLVSGDAVEEKQEASLSSAIRTIFEDASFSDVTLEGTDGARIPAHRCILSARSKVFESLLFGPFAEGRQQQQQQQADGARSLVRVGYDGDVLRAVVEYCYTDSVSFCGGQTDTNEDGAGVGSSSSSSSTYDDDDFAIASARTMISVAAAADFFALPRLGAMVIERAASLMDNCPHLAFACVTEACGGPMGSAAKRMEQYALDTIRSKIVLLTSLKKGMKRAVVSLSPSALEKILGDEDIMTHEILLFLLVEAWSCACDEEELIGDASSSSAEGNIVGGRTCREIASELVATHICLARVKPSDLCAIVSKSPLVTREQLFEAYKTQALCAEQSLPLSFPTRRGPLWETSRDIIYESKDSLHGSELLDCKPMNTGVHTWSVCVSKDASHTWIGVASLLRPPDRGEWLGKQPFGWVYGSNGAACHATGQDNGPYNCSFPSFGEGSVVTLSLNLTNGRGTLCASVDGGAAVQVFENMLERFTMDAGPSFVPAVSLRASGSVHFLGFEPSL